MNKANNRRKWHELGPFTIFDTETTGLSPKKNRLVEIAAIRVECDGSQKRYQSLINPECPIPFRATSVHHISDDDVSDAPTFFEVGKEFLEFAEDSTLVAHNAKFDLAFLQESLSRYYLPLWEGKTMDSIPVIKSAFPGLPSYSLQNLRVHFGLGSGFDGPAHRAFADVEWTIEIFAMAMQGIIDAQIE
jgi:DNA polymerase III epsilon subunit family exonuclease